MYGKIISKAFTALNLSVIFIFVSCAKHPGVVQKVDAGNGSEYAENSENFTEGNLIVKFDESVTLQRVEEINLAMNAEMIKKIGKENIYLVRIPKDVDVRHAAMKYMWFGEVIYAEPNYKKKAFQEE